MINYFKNIFVEDKEWIKENPYNKMLIDAKEQFNESFNKSKIKNPTLEKQFENSKKKSKLMASLSYKYEEDLNNLSIDFKIVKGYNFSYTLFKTKQSIGNDRSLMITYANKTTHLYKEKEFEDYLINEIFGGDKFNIIVSQLLIINSSTYDTD